MNKYEAMLIVRPDLSDEEKTLLFNQINEVVTKNKGEVSQGAVWSERKKLFFPLKKHMEGIYYLVSFQASGVSIKDMRHAYKLNENILRALITKLE